MVLVIQLLLLICLSKTKPAVSSANTLPGCQDSCGGVPIPYPFGIGRNCSMSEDFELSCNATNNNEFAPHMLGNIMILNISLSLGQARINSPVSYQCYNKTTKQVDNNTNWKFNLQDSPYRFDHKKNKFVVIGCDTLAYVNISDNKNFYLGGCVSGCYSPKSLIDGSCSGIGCCQTSIPKGTNQIDFWFDDNFNGSEVYNFSPCGYAMLIEEKGFTFNKDYITTDKLVDKNMSAVIDWAIGNTMCGIARTDKTSFACRSDNSICLNSSSGPGYLCNCKKGYQGNPYLEGGCRDIDECANQSQCFKPGKCHNLPGSYKCTCPFGWRNRSDNLRECELNLALLLGICAGIVGLSFLGLGTYVMLERRNLSKVKEKYFQQHGGWVLLEKIKSNQGFGFTIFTRQQIEEATKNFDSANIIGFGGHGTVYKGIIRDQIIAIKKCKIVDESKKKEFGKEMLILSQINHKNIVKLLGCCLEVEVPMLVYEFIPNGTLSDYIHKKQGSSISLANRLRIAQESAEALAYLHFSASPPIFHGDVKSTNILLDQNYTSKVSDFGASILVPTDEAQFVTLVQGTRGYLDPKYMQSCQLTNKSDVYSFGVVLLELLTRKPVIDVHAPEEERSLSCRFLLAMKEKKLQDLLDDEIKLEDDMEVIMTVAELAKECLNMKGEERPTMKEVAEELDRIRKIKQNPWGQEYHSKDKELLLGEVSHNIVIGHTDYFSMDKEAAESIAAGR
ncbi:hypothetical protein LUZ61_009165 [Rhynchospora tenuis]|uniref:Uncharacterized protein n=1 Tax=Rhynchospora tenuis TaxID=198213 RepID=A0AAD6EYA8_9POAL|nr:hypothetical protein LUZ61_009165 [Rhynchospora tenuis]